MKLFRFGVSHATALVFAVVATTSLATGQVTVWTQHNDNSRTGQNLQETVLNTSNVNVTTFGKLFSLPVDANIYTQPLYVPNLTVFGQTHNVVYVGTANNTVYAFDADSGNTTPLWTVSINDGDAPVPAQDICVTSPSNCPYTDVVPVTGILSTPVIDTSSGTMYVVAKSKDSSANDHFRLHALDLTTGTEKFGGPKEITASGQKEIFPHGMVGCWHTMPAPYSKSVFTVPLLNITTWAAQESG
jgi:outer membrane protein assembly factor BamB